MAQKRMFDKYIIDSDDFLEMPLTTQAVYFHLNMRADDDGFVDNWKSILRVVGGKEDDLKVLISKSFVLPFETGIIVIKHWKINNYLQKDRKKQTRHIGELKQLKEQNGEYFLLKNGETSNLLMEPKEKKDIPEWQKKRDEAYKNSSLPDSFSYKIRQAFNNKICPICGSIMQYNEKYKNYMPTIQHLLPISKGGVHEVENIAVICYSCNSSIRNDIIENKLNNSEVVKKWNEINGVFNECLTNGSIEENSIEENSIDKCSIDKCSIDNIYDFIEKNFGRTLSPIEYEEISTWEDTEVTRYAIKQSVLNGKYNIRYISVILNNYKKNSITTVQQAQEQEELFKKQQANRKPYQKQTIERSVPEWVGKEIKEEYLSDEEVAILDKLLSGEIDAEEYDRLKSELLN